MTDDLTHTLRSDAQVNRERILDAARALFRAEGLDVPMREVARHAEVGPATLYRHFATKQALVTAAFADQLRACRDIVDEACADPDPWRGFRTVIEKICELHARDRGFTEAFMSTLPGADITAVAESSEYQLKAVAALARRAKEAGRLRPDFTLDDLVLMLMANKGIYATSPALQANASRRFAGFVIQAFEACPHRTALPPAVTFERYEALGGPSRH